jgi:hypothetical protein
VAKILRAIEKLARAVDGMAPPAQPAKKMSKGARTRPAPLPPSVTEEDDERAA